jgi:mRNA interferase MazF
MKMHLETYDHFDIVVVPFPFVDTLQAKKRPALVLSDNDQFNQEANSCILAMITTSIQYPWPLDYSIKDWQASGLSCPSFVRLKLFTLDSRLILYRLGSLASRDQAGVRNILKTCFNLDSAVEITHLH